MTALLDKLEKRYGKYAIHKLPFYIMVGQAAALGFLMMNWIDSSSPQIGLNINAILSGEIWRLFTFILMPPPSNIYFMAFALFIFYSVGTSLEEEWGAFKFNAYILLNCIGTIIVGILFPGLTLSNFFMLESVLLAFAYLYPHVEFWFIIPFKAKWLGFLICFELAYYFVTRPAPIQFMVLSVATIFLLFFGKEISDNLKSKQKKAEREAAAREAADAAFHICAECGATDKSHPDREFRFKGNDELCENCLSKEDSKKE